MKKIKHICFSSIILLFLFISNSLSVENKILTSIGNKNTKITVKVFSSLSCPHCAHFHLEIFKKLKKEFIDTQIVRFEHHSFPLDLQALNAEKVLNCFENNNEKFNFLNELYLRQESWYRGEDINSINKKIVKIAKSYDLKSDKINSCLIDESLEDKILSERINGSKNYSIKSTPTIFINEKRYEGEYKYDDFRKEIKKLL